MGWELAAAAGAEQDDQGDDDDPGAVIVKEMAKAVVHQKVLRKNSLRGFCPLRYHHMGDSEKCECIFPLFFA